MKRTTACAQVWPWLVGMAVWLAGGGQEAVAQQPEEPRVIVGRLTDKDPFDRLRKQSRHKVHEVQLRAGTAYLIELRSPAFDTYLRLEDAAGKTLAENDDATVDDLNSRLGFNPPKTGTYQLVVTSFKGGQTGSYVLEVHPLEKAGPPQTLSGQLSEKSPTSKGLRYAAHKLALQTDRAYLLNLQGEKFAVVLGILDARKKLLAIDQGSGEWRAACLTVLPQTSAAYNVVVFAAKPQTGGAYRLTVQAYTGLPRKEESEVVRPEVAPTVFYGRLKKADTKDRVRRQSHHKVHEVKLAAGKAYAIDLLSSEFDAFLRLEDDRGRELDTDDDSGGGKDAHLLFVPKDGGTYRLVVTSYKGGETGAYLLAVQRFAREAAAQRRFTQERQLQALQEDGGQLYKSGDLSGAFAPGGRALELARQLYAEKDYPRGHPAVTSSLNNLGVLYHARGDYPRALEHHAKALALQLKLYGERHPDVATTLNSLGLLYHARGDYPRALEHYQKALALRLKLHGERHPDVASSLNNLGALYYARGDYPRALEHHEKALALRLKLHGERHPDLASSLNNLGALYYARGDYPRALEHHEKALALSRQLHGERHPHVASSLNNLGALHRDRGDYPRALEHYQKALALLLKLYGERHPDVATTLNNLGALYRAWEDYPRALEHHEKALALRLKLHGERHPDVATSLLNLGVLYRDWGDYPRSLEHHEKALAILHKLHGERHPYVASSLNALGVLYHARGDYPRALEHHEKALALRLKLHGERHPDVATSLSNLGALYRAWGDYPRALEHYQKALALRLKLHGERHPDVATSLSNLGELYYARGDYPKARHALEQAVHALRRPSTPLTAAGALPLPEHLLPLPLTVRVLQKRGRVMERERSTPDAVGSLRACADCYTAAAAVLERVRDEALHTEESKLHHGEDLSDLFPRLVGARWRLYQRQGHVRDLEEAFAAAERGRARVFLEALARARAYQVGGVSAGLRQQEQDLLARQRALRKQIAAAQGKAFEKQDAALIKRLYQEEEQAEADLKGLVQRIEREHPAYAAMRYPRPCSLTEARACLAKDEVALLYLPGSEASYALLVEPAGAPGPGLTVFPLSKAAELDDIAATLADPDTLAVTTRVRAQGVRAYRLMLAPLADKIRGKHLVIVPGGPLARLPFGLLVEPDGKGGKGTFLLESRRIRYAPSLTVLHLQRRWQDKRQAPDRPLWAAGDPVYGTGDARARAVPAKKVELASASKEALARYGWRSEGGLKYERLKYSGTEVRELARLLKARPDEVLTGLAASESAVKRASRDGVLARYRYVHFATHGILGLGAGYQPALVLSLVGDAAEDGFLRLDEVTNLKLNADLVVLSACHSGGGKLYNAEGVLGLGRAFLHAGSKGVLCSLWQVEDRSTAGLMQEVYAGLQQGQPAAEALRQAQLRLLRQGRTPLYWAPFILIGE